MRNRNRSQSSRRGAFFWKIPGDVPGYRSEPDPYQGERATRDPEYQGATSNKSGSVRSRFANSNGVGQNVSVSRTSRKWLALLLLLLIASGIVGYQKMYAPDPATTPKVFELTLGKQNQSSHSKVRIITHVVVKGDTLWDIANTYVKDPFRYPELAKLSKIKNPDLIYPYDLVRIRIYEPAK